ncbi:protein phosphatase 2C domain-containing protein [Actinomadura sp. 7K507]|uniref:protein phosphatase 2C domain-containing protein n=1 Tax=Actinomadura sp. 7K507 TaxID=2530365 RepID=UPI001045463C|nr:protein phosphatase 2C domain-containing protein [Actinomadura sp. 7K507]TDC76316.1 hypothetical protein E1285_40200 [Actinomadura sp. 7K507]
MRLVDRGEDAGSAGRPSEDRSGVAGNLAWVIDGASDFRGERSLPALSNVHWLVDHVHQALNRAGSAHDYTASARLLHDVQRDMIRELQNFDLAEMRQHPCCSLAVLLVNDDALELARVGDAVGFVAGDSGLLDVTTEFFDEREAAAVASARAQALTHEEVTAAMQRRRAEYIHGIAGESVFSGHPAGNLFIHTLAARRSAPFDTVLLSTDGLARAVSEYHLFDTWHDLLQACRRKNISSVIGDVRAYEKTLTTEASGKFKKSDDIAALLLEI